MAVDSAGDVYVVDPPNHRVQKFDPTAGPGEDEVEFLLDFGEAGAGNGQFGAWRVGSFIDIGPGDKVYVGDVGRVQVFDSGGNYLESIPVPGEIGAVAGGWSRRQRVRGAVQPHEGCGVNGPTRPNPSC